MNCPKCDKPNRDKAVHCKWCGVGVITKSNAPLQELVGMEQVKNQLQDLVKTCESVRERAKATGVKKRLGMDMVITGNTGTGKTKLVEVLQHLLYSTDIIKNPKAVIVDAVDFDDFSKKDDKVDHWEENTKKARGGLLVIENAQKLLPQKASDDVNKLDKLFKCMNDEWNNDPIVILSGLSGLKTFMTTNPDVANRFEYHFDLKDFSAEELTEMCSQKLKKDALELDEEARAKLERIFKHEVRNKKSDFGNAHLAVQKAEKIYAMAVKRDPKTRTVLPEDIQGTEFRRKTYDEIMTELDEFVGIDEIKETVQKLIHKMDVERERKGGNAKREVKDHFLFLGNPGTGKTTIARVFADILNSLDVLPTGQLIEVDRSQLVAGYVGQTALAVQEAVERAMGGILFVDEAYALKQNDSDSFGQEAIDTLLKLVEDNRGKFVCIAAGYSKEMADFLTANSGMASRFNETVNFRDYKPDELTEIFRRMVKKEKLTLDEEAEKHIENYFKKIYIGRNTKSFGNAREVRNVFDKALKNQGMRLQQLKATPAYTPDMTAVLARVDIEGEENLKEKDLDGILAELDEFIGMDSVKTEIRALANKLMMDRKMMERGFTDAELTNVHLVITGNPGTGKTTIALKLGEIFKAVGLLPTSKVVEKERKHLLSTYHNETAKVTDKACDEAMGGILFIDEAYTLTAMDKAGNQDKSGQEAVEALMTRMVKDAGKFVVVCAGYRKEMEEFIDNANPGFKRRFTTFLHIEDYTPPQLVDIFMLNAKKQGITLTGEAQERLKKLVVQMVDAKSANFGNAGEMTKLLDKAKIRKSNRLAERMNKGEEITNELFRTFEADDIPYDAPKAIDLNECMKELDNLVGLEAVKREVREMASYIEVERKKAEALGKKFQGVGDHYLFVGNPGTGKTTVARIMADIFYSLGVLPTNKLVEVTRKDLVAGYVGQTALQTEKAVKSAIGGVFFIDEAYSLKGTGSDFGQEATDTILPMMLDYKGKMVFVAAGYPREMQQWIDTNSGLESRFTKTIHFEDYTGDDLAKIFLMKAGKDQLELTPEAETEMRSYFNDLYENRGKNFANAREVNNYFDRVKRNQSTRIARVMNDPGFDQNAFKQLILEDFN
ncbi:MAG: AAA family ATPase [Culturomica sp.]|jgi:SpoVK/Ycf46/Vps4 family AAA+-type ATPase|nr:AAA family ATPase [Culturomica sp.]